MADELTMALVALLRKAEVEQDTDFPRAGVRLVAQAAYTLPAIPLIGGDKTGRWEEWYETIRLVPPIGESEGAAAARS
jgi:hypothetical protein